MYSKILQHNRQFFSQAAFSSRIILYSYSFGYNCGCHSMFKFCFICLSASLFNCLHKFQNGASHTSNFKQKTASWTLRMRPRCKKLTAACLPCSWIETRNPIFKVRLLNLWSNWAVHRPHNTSFTKFIIIALPIRWPCSPLSAEQKVPSSAPWCTVEHLFGHCTGSSQKGAHTSSTRRKCCWRPLCNWHRNLLLNA